MQLQPSSQTRLRTTACRFGKASGRASAGYPRPEKRCPAATARSSRRYLLGAAFTCGNDVRPG